MRLPDRPFLPVGAETEYDRRLSVALQDLLGKVSRKVNTLAAGRIAEAEETATAAPTSGLWVRGDQVRNSEPSELGSSGSRYVVIGWACVASGEPGTWVQCRFLTGN